MKKIQIPGEFLKRLIFCKSSCVLKSLRFRILEKK